MKDKSTLKLIVSEISAIGINLVPLSLWFFEDYSAETTMILYLIESIVAIALAALFVLLLSPKQERVENKTVERNKLIVDFLMVGGMMAFVLSIFATAFIFLVLKAKVTLADVRFGVMCIAAFQLFEFVCNLFLLRPFSLKQAEYFLPQSLGGLVLLHISIFIGIFLALFVDDWFVLPFIILKTIIDALAPMEFFSRKNSKNDMTLANAQTGNKVN